MDIFMHLSLYHIYIYMFVLFLIIRTCKAPRSEGRGEKAEGRMGEWIREMEEGILNSYSCGAAGIFAAFCFKVVFGHPGNSCQHGMQQT